MISTMITSSSWTQASAGEVAAIAINGDTIYCVGLDKAVYKQMISTMTTSGSWTQASAGEVAAIAINGDTIYGIARSTLFGGKRSAT